MMAQNAFLKKIDEARQTAFVAGCDITAQQMFDMMCIVLHDPKIMGTHAVSADRLKKIHRAMYELEAEFHSAWMHNQESDYYQEKLDDALLEIFGAIDPFKKRYPLCKEWDYNKPMKG